MRQGDTAGEHVPAGASPRRGRLRAAHSQRHLAPLLVVLTLLSTVGIATVAYIGARLDAVNAARARAQQDAQIARQLILTRDGPLALQNEQLVIGTGPTPLVLNNDSTLVASVRALVGTDATIFQLEGSRLVAISTTLPEAGPDGHAQPGTRALGETLGGPAASALVGSCGPQGPAACHQSYAGVVNFAGASYVAAFVPLYDGTGAFVGALGVATSLDSVLAPTVQLAVMLVLIGLLLALVSLVLSVWLAGRSRRRLLGALDSALREVADAAGALEYAARTQATRAGRQERMAQQVSEQIRALDTVAGEVEQGQTGLREASTAIWAEMSHPGAPADATLALHLARQAAVASARIGEATEDVHTLCRQLISMMNHLVADGHVIGGVSAEIEERARALRDSVEDVEVVIGKRLVQRDQLSSLPVLRRVRAGTAGLRRFLPSRRRSDGRSGTAASGMRPVERPRPAMGGYSSVARGSAGPAVSGRHPRQRPRTLGDIHGREDLAGAARSSGRYPTPDYRYPAQRPMPPGGEGDTPTNGYPPARHAPRHSDPGRSGSWWAGDGPEWGPSTNPEWPHA
jgi:hypothetical protein